MVEIIQSLDFLPVGMCGLGFDIMLYHHLSITWEDGIDSSFKSSCSLFSSSVLKSTV